MEYLDLPLIYIYICTCWYLRSFIYSFPMMPLPVAKPLSDMPKGNGKRKCHINAEDKNEYASINTAPSPAVPQPSVGK